MKFNFFNKKIALGVSLVLLELCRPAVADVKEAQRLYVEGSRMERSSDYQAALNAYQQSLLAEPRYFYSYRQIGICQRMLGNGAEAIRAFEKYLTFKPDDGQIRTLIQKLKSEAPQEARAGAITPFKQRFG